MCSTNFFQHLEHYVGIDVSKATLDCWLRPHGQCIQCPNTPDGFAELDEWLQDRGVNQQDTVICLENTGIYDDRLLAALSKLGWRCSVEKTTVLDKVTFEHHRKEDGYDAAHLAEYADRFADKLSVWTPPDDRLELLRQLYGERRRLVAQKAAVQSKQTQSAQLTVTSKVVEQSWNQHYQLYTQQIAAIETRMQALVSEHAGLDHYYQLLTGIPGIGQVTAWLWLILFYGEQFLNSKKIASRFGFAPHSYTSGSSVRGRTRSSGHGASQMRQCMALAARSASTHYPKFRTYKQRKLDEGKPWPVVRNNLINKLIKIISAIWNSGQSYDSDHTSRFNRQKNAA